MTTNPLLNFDELPRFSEIGAEHIEPAVSVVLDENKQRVMGIIELKQNRSAPSWQSLMAPLDEIEDRLSKVWSTVSHLNAVRNTPEIRRAYNICQPKITEYYTFLGQNRALFEAVQRLSARAEELQFDHSQRKILRDYLLEFRLAGVDLNEEKQKQFAEFETRLSNLSNRFSNNVLDATMAWSKHVTDIAVLGGLPEMAQKIAADLAARKGLDGFILTLDAPCYISVMTNSDDRELRREIYQAYVTRASDQCAASVDWDNRGVIDEILSCRAQLAELLGFTSYAEVSVARKMARSVSRVNDFLKELADLAVPSARLEYAELSEFAACEHAQPMLEAWDIPYFSEKLRKKSFDVSQEELRQYFPVDQVKKGLFEIARRLYDVKVAANTAMELWCEGVEAFDILKDGRVIARFYFDLFTREGKKSGAWMAECRSRRQLADESMQIPVAYLVCNFAQGSGADTSLLTHNEVTTLFHEFGHGLHHMLTREKHLRSSGINGVAWDAVELPSQLMENWCWEPEAIALISRHHKTGLSLPKGLLDKLLAAKNFQAGMKTVRQLEFALFDFELHQLSGPMGDDQVLKVMARVRALTYVYATPEFNRFQNSFSHIFAGGYAAGYYSYKWAEVLSADVFSRFAEYGVFNAKIGARFLEQVLAKGGGADPLELFTAFMGREPNIESLLRQDGLLAWK